MEQSIVVLDSGVGGLDILKYLVMAFENENFYYIADNANVPFGNKSKEEIERIGINLVKRAVSLNAKMIVIACNTLSLNAIDSMRKVVDIPIYGIAQPTIKGFLNHNKSSVLVLATKATVDSNRYVDFFTKLDSSVKVYQQSAPKLVECIEANDIDNVEGIIVEYVNPYIDKIDGIILACTHFPIVREYFNKLYPDLEIFDSRKQMVQLVYEKLAYHQIKASSCNKGKVFVFATGSLDDLVKASRHFFNFEDVELVKKGV